MGAGCRAQPGGGAAGPRRRHAGAEDAASGRYLQADAALASLAGCALEQMLGHTDGELFPPAVAAALRAADHTAMAQDEPLHSEHRLDWPSGRREFSVLRVVTPPDAQGRRLLCSVWHDPAPQRELQAQLRTAPGADRAGSSAPTRPCGASWPTRPCVILPRAWYSRAHFDDQLRREVDLSVREHREFALVFIEIDPPSAQVQGLGAAGEAQVLEAMGRLRGGTRAMDASCRIDQRRFAVLLSGVGLATAHARMEGLRRKCATQIVMLQGQPLGFTVAMGRGQLPAHGADPR